MKKLSLGGESMLEVIFEREISILTIVAGNVQARPLTPDIIPMQYQKTLLKSSSRETSSIISRINVIIEIH